MNKDLWNLNIQRSLKNLEALKNVFTKSSESAKRYRFVIIDFRSLFLSLSDHGEDSDYIRYAESINTRTSKYNDEGDNLKLKQNASFFTNRIMDLDRSEAVLFISELNAKDGYRFQSMLKEYGDKIDQEEEERNKQEAEKERRRQEEEERRRREEEERRKREAEERRRREEEERKKPKLWTVRYCTNCGTKFTNDEFKFCTQCGAKRHTFTTT